MTNGQVFILVTVAFIGGGFIGALLTIARFL